MKNIFYKDNCWNFTTKEVDHNNYQINYVTKSGYETQELAETAYDISVKQFEKSMNRLKQITGVRFTFSTYLTYWFQYTLQQYAFGSYQMQCAWVIYHIILPVIDKDILLSAVTTDYINEVLEACKPYSQSAAHSAKKVILVALADAAAEGLMPKIDIRFVIKCPENPPKIIVYSKTQIRTLLEAAREYHSVFLEILLAIFCGLRTGEILGLKVSDFDMEKHTVTISRQITRDYKVVVKNGIECKILSGSEKSVKPPKSYNSYRTLRVPAIIIDELRVRIQENQELLAQKGYTQEWAEYVCIGKKGQIKSEGTINGALCRLCSRYALPKISTHGLRHIFASILVEKNVPLERISKLLGHKNVKTTFEIYCGIINAFEETRQYIEKNLDPALHAVEKVGGTYGW